MKSSKILLSIYIIASILVVIAVFMDMYWLEYFLKPMILPALFFHYVISPKKHISFVVILLLLLNYTSDMFAISKYLYKGDVVIAMNFLGNAILTYFFVSDYWRAKNKTIKNKVFFVLFLVGFMGITFLFLTLIPNLNTWKLFYYIIYGLLLSIMATVTIQTYSITNAIRSFYAVIISIAFVITDTFYVIYNFYMPMKVFLVFNLAAQFGSYYYLMNYFTVNDSLTDTKNG